MQILAASNQMGLGCAVQGLVALTGLLCEGMDEDWARDGNGSIVAEFIVEHYSGTAAFWVSNWIFTGPQVDFEIKAEKQWIYRPV